MKTFRVLQLPPCVPINHLKTNFEKFGEVNENYDERMREEEFKDIGSGIWRFKVRFTKDTINRIE